MFVAGHLEVKWERGDLDPADDRPRPFGHKKKRADHAKIKGGVPNHSLLRDKSKISFIERYCHERVVIVESSVYDFLVVHMLPVQ